MREQDEITIDLMELWRAVKKSRRLVVLATGCCVAAAGLYLLVPAPTMPPTYTSEALLRVKRPRDVAASMLANRDAGAGGALIRTYSELLQSRQLLDPVISQLKAQGGAVANPLVAAVPIKDTADLLRVTVTSNTAEGARLANQLLIEGFLKKLGEPERNELRAEKEFIEKREAASRQELDAARERLADFKKEHAMTDPGMLAQMAKDRMNLVIRQSADQEIVLEASRARLEAVTAQLGANMPVVSDSAELSALQEKLAALEAARLEIQGQSSWRKNDQADKLDQINKDIAEARSALQLEIDRAARQAQAENIVLQQLITRKYDCESDIAAAEQKIRTLGAQRSQIESQIEKLPGIENEYLTLVENVNLARDTHTMLAKRLEEARVAENAVPNNVQIVDEPTLPPGPAAQNAKPKLRPRLLLLLAAFLGAAGSCGCIVLKELLNRTVKTPDDVEDILGLPLLGAVPNYDSVLKKKQPCLIAKLRGKLWKA